MKTTHRVTMIDDLDRVIEWWAKNTYTGFNDTGPVRTHKVYIDFHERKIITVMEVEDK